MRAINGILLLLSVCIFSCKAPKDLIYQNVQDFKLEKAGLEQTALSMDIRLYNPNNYTLKLKKADVDVYLNDTHLGKMSVKGKFAVRKLDTLTLPVVLDVELKNILPNALQLLMNSEVDIKLKGTLKAGRRGVYINIPIDYEGKQDIMSGVKW